jgi:hypothetical protein
VTIRPAELGAYVLPFDKAGFLFDFPDMRLPRSGAGSHHCCSAEPVSSPIEWTRNGLTTGRGGAASPNLFRGEGPTSTSPVPSNPQKLGPLCRARQKPVRESESTLNLGTAKVNFRGTTPPRTMQYRRSDRDSEGGRNDPRLVTGVAWSSRTASYLSDLPPYYFAPKGRPSRVPPAQSLMRSPSQRYDPRHANDACASQSTPRQARARPRKHEVAGATALGEAGRSGVRGVVDRRSICSHAGDSLGYVARSPRALGASLDGHQSSGEGAAIRRSRLRGRPRL